MKGFPDPIPTYLWRPPHTNKQFSDAFKVSENVSQF